ncbi:AraC family transcriptional regulator [Jannaschia sp. M317]|uniref:helix-turn-helix transcriptional regulator n=1 Tax=Jannaschia sp. M317 TaxID=2867011 RepID=UPI0021A28006|nr:AraC family transcriptional regulator [Jannaschia sp. M317]UWQ16650.1 AraC family transcriptional regulator [Jannaschia sp. M317]
MAAAFANGVAMSRIRLFEARTLTEAERLRGMRQEMVTPLARSGRWRREEPHADTLPVLIWIARGQGRVTINARTRGFGPATCIVLPPGTPFALEPGAMTEGTLARLPELFEAPLPDRPRRLRLSEVAKQGEIAGLLDRLAQAGDLTDPPSGRAALARVILLSALIEREGRATPDTPLPAPARLAERFAKEVERQLGTGANLETIGEALDVTPTHLTRTLRDSCGMTASRYLTARLMHEARRRLADTHDSAASISAGLGFSSPAYFTRAFGNATGLTPSEFRRREGRAAAS